MKQNKELIQPTPNPDVAELTTYIDGQAEPLLIRGDYETLQEVAGKYGTGHKPAAHKAAVKAVEATTAAPEQYINLGALDERTAARMALKCLGRDIRNFGRTHKYQEFKQRRWAEQNAAFDMEVGLVDAVHCRLHERVLAKSSGLTDRA
jgi:hypothetical protein